MKKVKNRWTEESRKWLLHFNHEIFSTTLPDDDIADIGIFDMPEDVSLHERWLDVLENRRVHNVSDDELYWLIPQGMPLQYRHTLWPRWWHQADPVDVGDLQRRAPPEAAMQIELDLARTLPNHLQPDQRGILRRVLRAFSVHRPDIGYCQGMNFIAAIPLLLCFGEADSFAALCFVLQTVCPGYHGHRLEGFCRDVRMLNSILRRSLPDVMAQIDEANVPVDVLAVDHLLSLSANTWPLAAVVRLWDLVLLEHSAALIASFLALLQMYFADALIVAKQDIYRDNGGAGIVADVVSAYRKAIRLNIVSDILEVMLRSMKFIPLVRAAQDAYHTYDMSDSFPEYNMETCVVFSGPSIHDSDIEP